VDLELDGRVVLVTGGTSGIGLATVDALLAEGAMVATCGRDGPRLAASLESRSSAELHRLLAQTCDVRRPDQVEALVAATIERFGRLDGLVNNAGQSRMKPYRDTVWEDWVDELDLKFAGVLHPLGAALPHLKDSPTASVVNINAVLARQPETRLITTSAARAGVLNLSKSLAQDLAADGIRVNSVCLGLIDTGQWRRRYEQADTSQTWEAWSGALADDRGIVLGRLGTAAEAAAAILFLLSARASYITGTTIEVSGGVSRYV
jgi:NAD(P)-dependent dehydrogenase (short-subunit alcohol dehydrogenase family)